MRLIDADKIVQIYEDAEDDDLISAWVVKRTIECFPTAYDIDKVVEELEDWRDTCVDGNQQSTMDIAIEIVKKGGAV